MTGPWAGMLGIEIERMGTKVDKRSEQLEVMVFLGCLIWTTEQVEDDEGN